MKRDAFEEPLRIFAGLNFCTDITSVSEAYAFLDDWPHGRRGPGHATALRACRAALNGEIEAETARATFAAFARRAGILAPKIDDIVAASVVRPFDSPAAG